MEGEVMRYLHEEFFTHLRPATLLRMDDEQIEEKAWDIAESGKDVRSTVAVERQVVWLVEMSKGFRSWLRDGRRVVMLSPLTVEALLESPPVDVGSLLPPERTVEVVLEQHGQVFDEMDDGSPVAFLGGVLVSGSLACVCLPGFEFDGQVFISGATLTSPDLRDDIDARNSVSLLRRVLRALNDERTHWIEPRPKRNRTQARKDKKAGLNVGRLVLAEDALAVWKRRHLMEHERSRPTEPVVRGPVSPHEVRPHLCRQWVLEPELGEAILEDKLHRAAKEGQPAVWLYCVRRERRGHVRGGGEVRAKVERVVPCL